MFTAAGKPYLSVKQLTHRKTGEHQGKWNISPTPICEDVHGRQVIALHERFPCFDSYDNLHESRRYNWYFIKHGSQIAAVYTADVCPQIYTCDVLLSPGAKDCRIPRAITMN